MSTIHDMIEPSSRAAEDAMSVLQSKGLSSDKAERLRDLVSIKVQAVYSRIASENDVVGEFEEIWECVSSNDPEISGVADQFIEAEALKEQPDLVTAIRDFVRAQALFCRNVGYYQSPQMDDDDDPYGEGDDDYYEGW